MSQPVAVHRPSCASGTLAGASTTANTNGNNSISIHGVPIATIATAGVQLGSLDLHVFDFLPIFTPMYEWWKRYIPMGRTAVCGGGSFVDIEAYGTCHHTLSPRTDRRKWFLENSAICLTRYEGGVPRHWTRR
jgi:hypothetical protein